MAKRNENCRALRVHSDLPRRLSASGARQRLAQLTASGEQLPPLSPRLAEPNDQVSVQENDGCWLVRIGDISVFEVR